MINSLPRCEIMLSTTAVCHIHFFGLFLNPLIKEVIRLRTSYPDLIEWDFIGIVKHFTAFITTNMSSNKTKKTFYHRTPWLKLFGFFC